MKRADTSEAATIGDRVKKRKNVELRYYNCHTEMGKVLLPERPANLSGLRIDIFPDEILPNRASSPVRGLQHQLHISGTPHALRALGTYLIAIAENKVPRDFLEHFENIRGANDRPVVHLVVHHAYRRGLGPTIEIL
jgi:hypothetical protein